MTLVRAVLCGLVLSGYATGNCQPLLWGELKPGAYAVGFKSYWALDSTRTYDYKFSDGSLYGEQRPPRPILVDVWYPALPGEAARPMSEGGYLDFVPAQPSLLTRFAQDLVRKNREVIAGDVLGSAAKSKPLDDFLSTPTAAFRNAKPAPGRFPLAVYIQGYGSSLQDNSALCEYLASHGYVVLGSAYQDDEGAMIAGRDTATDDVRFLVGLARDMPEVDFAKVGVIGHSGGAQTSMIYASQEDSIVDAVVSLDTTQDYYFKDKELFKAYVDRVNPDHLHAPLLVAAGQAAIFELVDQCGKSDRTYLTVDELGHDEFTSEGLAAAIVQHKKSLGAVRDRYSSLCEMVLRFLDAKLKGVPGELAKPPVHFGIDLVPAGVDVPKPYQAGPEPPSPRQFREIVYHDMARAIQIVARFAKSRPAAPIYDEQLAFAVIDHCLEKKDIKSARNYAAALKRAKGKEVVGAGIYLAWGRIYTTNGFKSEAIRSYEKALMLDPSNKKAKSELAKLRPHLP